MATTNLTKDDEKLLAGILDADQEERKTQLIREYWSDRARAKRTGLQVVFFHFGILSQCKGNRLAADILARVVKRKVATAAKIERID